MNVNQAMEIVKTNKIFENLGDEMLDTLMFLSYPRDFAGGELDAAPGTPSSSVLSKHAYCLAGNNHIHRIQNSRRCNGPGRISRNGHPHRLWAGIPMTALVLL